MFFFSSVIGLFTIFIALCASFGANIAYLRGKEKRYGRYKINFDEDFLYHTEVCIIYITLFLFPPSNHA